jgi:ATP-dependent DNA helicase RecG
LTPSSTRDKALPKSLEKLGLRSRFDFVLHLPLRYEDETTLADPQQAPAGRPVQVQAKVLSAKVAYRPRRQLIVHADGLALRFFNFWGSQLKQFQRAAEEGKLVRAFGEVRPGFFGAEMAHPRYTFVDANTPLPDALTPVYPTTSGVSQKEIRAAVLRALDEAPMEDTLPVALRRRYELDGFAESVEVLHRPLPGTDIESIADHSHPAWRRMIFDELLAQQLSMRFAYRKRRAASAPELSAGGKFMKAFLGRLPFELTAAQTRSMNDVLGDLREPHPMQRLLQGDVGSGKTVVAGLACLAAADAGWQAAVMAPTEILAEQHWRKFNDWFAPLGVPLAWLHGGLAQAQKRSALRKLKNGECAIVVGTHALVQKSVEFARLGLAVIDEQHRFGVQQRVMLRRKAGEAVPHQLMMSATPIPRTLSMTHYADLDVSVIDEMPPGRRPVVTRVFSAARRGEVVERIRDACAGGQQAYWVCPVIEESKDGDVQTAIDTHARLQAELKRLRIGLLHGRMDSASKAAAIDAFRDGGIHLLVCTTVIEVGVDVPNASLMVIESAERFGLAQLHQLRGRVGRGARDSVCVLLYGEPLQGNARARLRIILKSSDGFEIAQRDLELRGPGEVVGERQSGSPLFRFADLTRDTELVRSALEAADELVERDPDTARAHVERWLGGRTDLTHA